VKFTALHIPPFFRRALVTILSNQLINFQT